MTNINESIKSLQSRVDAIMDENKKLKSANKSLQKIVDSGSDKVLVAENDAIKKLLDESPTVFVCDECGILIGEDEFADLEGGICDNCEVNVMIPVRMVAESDIEDTFESIGVENEETEQENEEDGK